eukprot:CAMPEP_0202689906 /NCGR_PEP_ID=MMETSP1385-20130828/5077_1 /ASSEMBLY_ACC=CAM_ASM_000861 /TAXON_ID=933848 /ORGANISM="Elphidium margaritaceum" /LENGTH=207 /DNA_ID=CAMNT_0049345121 /DNA_START=83 /DNA_END=706 /DNA_ORIENTATION=+
MAKCVPTPRARQLGRLLWYLLIILFILMIVGFFGNVSTSGLFCIGLVITGLCGVRSNDCYDIEQIMCVVFFSGYLWVFSLVGLILYLVDGGQSPTALVSFFGGVVFYAFTCYFSKQLYDELRLNYTALAPDQQPGMFGGGGGGFGMGRFMNRGQAYQQADAPYQNQQGAYDQRPVNPEQGNIPPYQASSRQASQKFQAFKGPGHSLG